jgi:DNA-binding response OmpR family regulator
VEDNPAVQHNNRAILTRRGYRVREASNLAEARAAVAEEEPDAIILDIMLPDGSGLDFLRELRCGSRVPVLMLTALGTSADIARGLREGGDDYLAKPYDLNVFLARVEALLRRARQMPEVVTKGALTLRPVPMIATLDGKDLALSRKEFALLMYFLQHEGQVMTAEQLYERVWDGPMLGGDNAVKVTLSKLRRRIESSGYTIASVYGQGYRLKRTQ